MVTRTGPIACMTEACGLSPLGGKVRPCAPKARLAPDTRRTKAAERRTKRSMRRERVMLTTRRPRGAATPAFTYERGGAVFPGRAPESGDRCERREVLDEGARGAVDALALRVRRVDHVELVGSVRARAI